MAIPKKNRARHIFHKMRGHLRQNIEKMTRNKRWTRSRHHVTKEAFILRMIHMGLDFHRNRETSKTWYEVKFQRIHGNIGGMMPTANCGKARRSVEGSMQDGVTSHWECAPST